jgi:hypothetical protein
MESQQLFILVLGLAIIPYVIRAFFWPEKVLKVRRTQILLEHVSHETSIKLIRYGLAPVMALFVLIVLLVAFGVISKHSS